MTSFGRPQVELIAGGEHHDMSRVRLALRRLLAEDELPRVRCSPDFGNGSALAGASEAYITIIPRLLAWGMDGYGQIGTRGGSS